MFRIAAILMTSVLACGCVSIGTYPDQWAEQVKLESGDCPSIDGEYLNAGESLDTKSDELMPDSGLAQVLSDGFGFESDALGAPTGSAASDYKKVRLELVDETLKIAATRTDGQIDVFDRPVERRCKDSMWVVDVDWSTTLDDEEVPTSVLLHFLERESWKLGRAEDGSLLLHVAYGGSVMVLEWPIFPVLASGWIRFPAAPTATARVAIDTLTIE
jgi:hypothetical protein